MSKYTVMIGAPFDVQKFYGVFDTFDEAEEWADANTLLGFPQTWIVEILDSEHEL
mgnify:CR=1 FL=1